MPWMATISDIDEWTGVNQPDAILGDQSIKDFFSPNAVIVIVNHALSLLRLIAFDPNPKLDKQKLRLLCSGCNLPTLMSRLTLTAFCGLLTQSSTTCGGKRRICPHAGIFVSHVPALKARESTSHAYAYSRYGRSEASACPGVASQRYNCSPERVPSQ